MKSKKCALSLLLTFCLALALPVRASATNFGSIWHLDAGSGTTFSDTSGNGNNGTLCVEAAVPGAAQDPTWTTSAKFGDAALAMNGGACGSVPSSPSLSPTNAISVEAWFMLGKDTGSSQVLVSKWDSTAANQSYKLILNRLSATSFQPEFIIQPSIGSTFSANAFFARIKPGDGKWHHLTGVYKSGLIDAAVIYVDGQWEGFGVGLFAMPITVNTTAVLIGAQQPSGANGFFSGSIDEVRIWDRDLTGPEVLASAQAGLHALYHFDEGTGTKTADSSGYNNGGAFVSRNGPAGSPWIPSPVAVNFNKALSFDGGDAVVVPHSSELMLSISSPGWTIALWAKSSVSTSTDELILGKAAGCVSGINYLLSQSGGALKFTSGANSVSGSMGLSQNTLHHVAVTFDPSVSSGTVTIYLDGTGIGSAGSFPLGGLLNSSSLEIGNAGGCTTGGFQGSLDEVSIWSRALSTAEIAVLSGKTGATEIGPLYIPNEASEQLGSGAVFGSDWHVGSTSPVQTLIFMVPDISGTTISSIGVQSPNLSTPPGSNATLQDSGIGLSGMSAIITADRGDTSGGALAQSLHVRSLLSDGSALGQQVQWAP